MSQKQGTYVERRPDDVDAGGAVPVVRGEWDILPPDPEKFLEKMDKALDFQKKLRRVLIKNVDPDNDIIVLGERGKESVCITKPLIYKWLQLIGGTIVYPKDDHGFPLVRRYTGEDKDGAFFGFEAFATFIAPNGREYEGTATVTSRDKFFGREGVWEYDPNQNKRVRTGTALKDTKDILEENVRAAAVTMAEKNAVKKGLGIVVFTRNEIQEMGLDPDNLAGYKFKGKQQQGGQRSSGRQKQKPKPEQKSEPPKEKTKEEKLGPESKIDDTTRTKIMEYCDANGVKEDDLTNILGGLGYERLSQVQFKALDKLKKELDRHIADSK